MNNTNQTVTLKQGWSIARVNETSSITEITVPDKQTSHISDEELQQVNVSEEFKPEIDGLLKEIETCLLVKTNIWAGLMLSKCVSILEHMSP